MSQLHPVPSRFYNNRYLNPGSVWGVACCAVVIACSPTNGTSSDDSGLSDVADTGAQADAYDGSDATFDSEDTSFADVSVAIDAMNNDGAGLIDVAVSDAQSIDAGSDSGASQANFTLQRGRVLMIGNSHTVFGPSETNIPDLWHRLNPDFEIDRIAFVGQTLATHAGNADTLRDIEQGVNGGGPYDVLVLQEQSRQYFNEDYYDTRPAATLVAAARRGNPCVLVVFSQIQVDAGYKGYEENLTSYQITSARAARNLGGIYAPMGDVFGLARTVNQPLYNELQTDLSCCGYHTTPLGGYVHALILDMLVTGQSSTDYGALSFDPAKAATLRGYADQVLSPSTRSVTRANLSIPSECVSE